VAERNAAIETDYRNICEVFPAFGERATLDDFKWARMCVCSRNFGIVVDGLRTSAMVPYADMLNHFRCGAGSFMKAQSTTRVRRRQQQRHTPRTPGFPALVNSPREQPS